MKKLAFVFAAVVAVSFASCGNSTEKGSCSDSCAADTEIVEVEVEEVADSACCSDSCCAADSVEAPVAE